MITRPVPSCNTFNTSHLIGIVKIKKVYLKIPSISEHINATKIVVIQNSM